MNDLYIVALMTGLVGSLHCIGMCGPIAVALPLGNKSWFHKVIGSIIYNAGRVVTYALLGIIFGLLGQGIEMAGLQQWASIGLGIVLILSVLFPVLFKGQVNIDRFFFGFASKLIGKFRKLFSISSYPSLLVIGLLNGLLPCGLVYVAIAGAINTNDIVHGAIYMSIFGVGTIPIMASIPIVGSLIGTNIRKRFKGVVSAFIIILGIIFILRGLSLGIPYVSPPKKMLQPHEKTMKHNTSEITKETIPCCH